MHLSILENEEPPRRVPSNMQTFLRKKKLNARYFKSVVPDMNLQESKEYLIIGIKRYTRMFLV